MKKADVIKAKFISVWDEATEIITNAIYNTRTGEVVSESVENLQVESLDRQYLLLKNGEEIEVCRHCNCHVLRTVVLPDGAGNGCHESLVCADRECQKENY